MYGKYNYTNPINDYMKWKRNSWNGMDWYALIICLIYKEFYKIHFPDTCLLKFTVVDIVVPTVSKLMSGGRGWLCR